MRNNFLPGSARKHACRLTGPILGVLVMAATSACDPVTEHEPGQLYEDLVAGGDYTCALSVEGDWYCWGKYYNTRVGSVGPAEEWDRPTLIMDDPGLVTLSAGLIFMCGLTAAGVGYCWGDNLNGGLGLGYLGGIVERPQPVEREIRFDQLAIAGSPGHMCALSQGEAYCWGNNFRKQLGAGVEDSEHPWVEPVLGDHSFVQVTAGGPATCALTVETDVYCWGALEWGLENDLPAPELIAAETGFTTLVAGNGVRCGLRSGRAHCHGLNSTGALGTGDIEPHEGFVEVAGGHEFRELSGGRVHICGIATEDQAYCWGAGTFGRLGNGSEERALVPVPVSGGHGFEQIAAGGEHTCGLTVAGKAYCWGSGRFGQMGNGTRENQLVPTPVGEPVRP